MSRAHSNRAKLSLLLIVVECAAASSVVAFLDEGTLYERLVVACLWLALLLPTPLGFLYNSTWNRPYPLFSVVFLSAGVFFYDLFMPTIMATGVPLTLFDLSIVLPAILLFSGKRSEFSWIVKLLGFLICTIYVFSYSYFHYGTFVSL